MKKKTNLIMLIILFVGIGIDQLTKILITTNLTLNQTMTIIPHFFDLTYVRNFGGAWSILSGHLIFFYLITIIALVVMFGFYHYTNKIEIKVGLTLMIAGTIGNFIDRLCFGYVRDFLAFDLAGYHFPVFNFADMLLVIGVIIICIMELFGDYIDGRKIIRSSKRDAK